MKRATDQDWAKQAVGDMLHGLLFNEMLVNRGMWPRLIADMRDEFDLDSYSSFAIGLRDLYTVAKKVEHSRRFHG